MRPRRYHLRVLPTDEARHEAGAAHGWSESWYFDFADDAGTGGFVHLALRPGDRRAWYWACFVEPDTGPVVVRDHEVGLPRGAALEIRAEGLWAECVPETPWEHWSLGLEAFGVRLDDPFDAFRGELGERLPVGLDLSWEATVDAHEPAGSGCGAAGYLQAGQVHGDVLVGPRRVGIDATGLRAHTWGPDTWLTHPWSWAGACTGGGADAFAVTTFADGAASGARWRAGQPVCDVTSMCTDGRPGEPPADGPGPAPATRVTIDGERYDVDVLAWTPLALETPDGRVARLWRALCRYRGAHGDGFGWSAWMPASMEER